MLKLITTPDELGPCQEYCEELKQEIRRLRAEAQAGRDAAYPTSIAQARDAADAVRALVLRSCEEFSKATGADIRVEARPLLVQTMGCDLKHRAGYTVDIEVRLV